MNSEAAKPTLKSRLDDLWDTYKWLILAAALILIVIVTLVIQSLTRTKPDMTLLYIDADGVTEQEALSLQTGFAAIGADTNEDGEYYLELITLTSDASKISGEYVYDTNVLTAFNTDV
ncbi:MAG TPA: hypothetical protein PLT66_08500, partial [Bacillota bacterium]|nr:hypothetical protein [Bacillota bacterium]